ncbi:uncharacterized protein EV420DRAFT_1640819 [Desarmillaria tabescens]|uniref:Matrin-type domain-containing protein n=1 Tax=Armillaria tabescens TaxID=1929756 RepID=A0AA39TJJ9_ARMTA|nr:uncharacterized protein EV420DRAFT_1640819 [Desarmillaria tabescens]KAK0461337.1 hypothetical protein EV420DRAFT_1640819 [Desarmillaria tabescens]
MSEYWVSKKKYFCKYCDIYITDDAPSRQQHENGLRHKGNRDRFIRGLYKEGERRKKDQAEEKREMARVEQAAQAAFAVDVGAGFARPSAPQPSTSTAPPKPKPKSSNLFADYSTAASLGYTDPDAERISLEALRRRSEGVAGNWEVVESIPTQDTESSSSEVAGVKRPADDHSSEDSRHFQLRKRTLDTGLGRIYDPGAIPIKRKKIEESEADISGKADSSSGKESLGSSDVPASKWKRAGETNADSKETETRLDPSVKDEEDVKVEESVPDVKPDISNDNLAPAQGTSLFRKRKAVVGGTRGKRSI